MTMYRVLKNIRRENSIRLFILSLMLFFISTDYCQDVSITTNNTNHDRVVIQQVKFDANNISTWIINTGIFNQDLTQVNWPGFEWPKGTGKFAVFTTGLCIGAYVDDSIREAVASYKGELAPGYVVDTLGSPTARTNCSFKIYKVKNTEPNSNDWLHWGQMVPRGAPFVDVNGNGSYEPAVDTPGMSGASQTIFVCLTDGFYEEHKIGEGFGGGTHPLYAELHLTAWAYTIPGLQDVQFFKWVVINRGRTAWEKTYFAIFSDCDLGFPNDDYNGCDTVLQLGYTYNSTDMDGTGQGESYGLHPPAVGFVLLQGAANRYVYPAVRLKMTSFDHVMGTSTPGPICEKDPNGEPIPAYYLMSGRKKDQTPWVVPPGELAMLLNSVTQAIPNPDRAGQKVFRELHQAVYRIAEVFLQEQLSMQM
jgi:hypothetical protein